MSGTKPYPLASCTPQSHAQAQHQRLSNLSLLLRQATWGRPNHTPSALSLSPAHSVLAPLTPIFPCVRGHSGPTPLGKMTASPISGASGPSGSSSRSTTGSPGASHSVTGAAGGTGKTRGKRTRKKVAKACLACQKSHLTCDERESGVRRFASVFAIRVLAPCRSRRECDGPVAAR